MLCGAFLSKNNHECTDVRPLRDSTQYQKHQQTFFLPPMLCPSSYHPPAPILSLSLIMFSMAVFIYTTRNSHAGHATCHPIGATTTRYMAVMICTGYYHNGDAGHAACHANTMLTQPPYPTVSHTSYHPSARHLWPCCMFVVFVEHGWLAAGLAPSGSTTTRPGVYLHRDDNKISSVRLFVLLALDFVA